MIRQCFTWIARKLDGPALSRVVSWLAVRYVDGLVQRETKDLPADERRRISNCLLWALEQRRIYGGAVVLVGAKSAPREIAHAIYVPPRCLPPIAGRSFQPADKQLLFNLREVDLKAPAFDGAVCDEQIDLQRSMLGIEYADGIRTTSP